MKTYRVLVTGSREWHSPAVVATALDAEASLADSQGLTLVVVHGACHTGADAFADAWARRNGRQVERHPAQWGRRADGTYDKTAGPRRNRQMVSLGADVCLAFLTPSSRGGASTAQMAERAGIPVNRYTAD